MDYQIERNRMVEFQIAARGVENTAVLQAMRDVPREEFVPENVREFAYGDSPLPIEEGQTISQPYIVALMTEALELSPEDRVLDIGTGSGYAAAILSRVASEVYTVERHESLARTAEKRLLPYDNVHVLHGDGTLGWPEHAPYQAIVVAAGGPDIPEALLKQLAVGGRLVIPVGDTPRLQKLVRVRRVGPEEIRTEDLGGVQFVPLVGKEGWSESGRRENPKGNPKGKSSDPIRSLAEPLTGIREADLDPLLERIGDARVVLLGEASHGTAEFYEMRARITQELIERKGFDIVAVEADWPDAAAVDRYVRNMPVPTDSGKFFTRFPTWMWANASVLEFLNRLRDYNSALEDPERKAGFYGLDLYSLYSSIDAVLKYLDDVDPKSARVARQRYGCLTPYAGDPATYGAAALTGRYRECEEDVTAILRDLLQRRTEYAQRDGARFMDAAQNARLITNAERYYRAMYYGGRESWNLRDTHMFETLEWLLAFKPDSKAVIWAHNSHIGDASATEMGARGELNIGQLCREKFKTAAYLVGFGTHSGTVAAASDWDGPMEAKTVRPSHPESYERICHDTQIPSFLLPLEGEVRAYLLPRKLERAIGVIYLPQTELQSHYFQASLPRQFDEYVWFDETRAVTPLGPEAAEGMPDTYPFGV